MLQRKCMKRADSTIEIALTIVLSVIVVSLILTLFSGNLKTIVNNSGIGKLLHRNNEVAKTNWDTDPVKTQVNVQIVADQGSLAQYHNNAAATIERYATESQTDPLTDENIKNLAKQLTIYAESGSSQASTELGQYITGTGTSYRTFGSSHGVYVTASAPSSYYTMIGTKKITWGGNDKINKYVQQAEIARLNSATGPSNSPQVRVQNIETIGKIFDSKF